MTEHVYLVPIYNKRIEEISLSRKYIVENKDQNVVTCPGEDHNQAKRPQKSI